MAPYYAWCIGWVAMLFLNLFFETSIEKVHVYAAPQTIMNTSLLLEYVRMEEKFALPVSQLINNAPSYWALCFSTSERLVKTHWWGLFLGSGILWVIHQVYIVWAFLIQSTSDVGTQVTNLIGMYLLIVPMVLWVGLIVWPLWIQDLPPTVAEAPKGTPDGGDVRRMY